VDNRPPVGAFVDFGLYFFHNARELLDRGSGPYFYLPKPKATSRRGCGTRYSGTPKSSSASQWEPLAPLCSSSTIPAAFEINEILFFEVRDHASGLNAGRWDCLFSVIKTFRDAGPDFVLPDRFGSHDDCIDDAGVHRSPGLHLSRRGAFAIGGITAFIPSRRDAEVDQRVPAKAREDKEREASDGFDGSWVAHPDLVAIC
jgi:malate synthase